MSRTKKISQKEVCDGLRKLAFGDITDAVGLLFEDEEEILRKLPKLDLFNVSEIKRPKGGGMEIKFFEQECKKPTSFYEALEKSAKASRGQYGEEYDE